MYGNVTALLENEKYPELYSLDMETSNKEYLGLTEKANAHQKKRRKQEKMGENSTILPRDVVQ